MTRQKVRIEILVNIVIYLSIYLSINQSRGSSRGAMVNILDCDIVVSKFELQSQLLRSLSE